MQRQNFHYYGRMCYHMHVVCFFKIFCVYTVSYNQSGALAFLATLSVPHILPHQLVSACARSFLTATGRRRKRTRAKELSREQVTPTDELQEHSIWKVIALTSVALSFFLEG